MTKEEEKKFKNNIAAKKYYQNNQKKIRAARELAKEARSVYNKAHYESNKEYYKAKHIAYNKKNKERIKEIYESSRLDYVIVYCLPHYNKNGFEKYVGITDNPSIRMSGHSTVKNNTKDWFILSKHDTRKEALKEESRYHDLGYGGRNESSFKKNKI